MQLGIMVRNMGPASQPDIVAECARHAEQIGLDSVWVCDHIAIPREDSEGSGGRYLDPLATLAFLAGITQRIQLGITVLIVPYRPLLPSAKWIATVQELSQGRLQLGVGVGWMEAEFRALGVDRTRRGAITDEALSFFNQCFNNDEVELNGQRFLFAPRPTKPPILVGGAGNHCFQRIVQYGDGWMPMGLESNKLVPGIKQLRESMANAGRPTPTIVPLGALPLDDAAKALDRLNELSALGVSSVIQANRYSSVSEFKHFADKLATIRMQLGYE